MSNGQNRGLAGKARLVHHRSRATRRSAEQHIEEFFHPTPGQSRGGRTRPIPIRSRREFLPSVATGVVTPAGTQLELPLTEATPVGDAAIRIKHKAALIDKLPAQRRPDGKPALKSPLSEAAARRPVKRGADQPFSLRGFLCGCAMGSAAAAAILLVLSITFG